MGCQKSLTAVDTSRGTAGVDSTGTPGNGTQLVSLVTHWSLGSAPSNDSMAEQFSYDPSGHVILASSVIFGEEAYYRDARERIIKMGTPQTAYSADSFFTYVQYQSETGGQVLFTVFQNNGSSPKERDSTVFTYSAGRVAKTSLYAATAGSTAMVNYQTYTYDGNGNVTQLYVYLPDGTLNIGYDFMYDDKVNPQYDADDARLPLEWGYILSPNNIVKQVNHYGNPPQMPSDYVAYTHTYDAKGLPVTRLQSGTAFGTGQETGLVAYYYQ